MPARWKQRQLQIQNLNSQKFGKNESVHARLEWFQSCLWRGARVSPGSSLDELRTPLQVGLQLATEHQAFLLSLLQKATQRKQLTMRAFDAVVERRLLDQDPTLQTVTVQASPAHIPDHFLPNVAQRAGWALLAVRLPTITSLSLSLDMFDYEHDNNDNEGDRDEDGAFLLACHVVTSQPLRHLTLLNGNSQPPVGRGQIVVQMFVTAMVVRIQFGVTPIQSLRLAAATIEAQDVIRLVRDCSLKYLALNLCCIVAGIAFPTDRVAVRAVAAAFGANTTLVVLQLSWSVMSEAYFCAILNAFQNSATSRLKKIELTGGGIGSNEISATVVSCIVDFFTNAVCPLQAVVFRYSTWTGHSFGPIAESMRSTRLMLDSIELYGCALSREACLQLGTLFGRDCSFRRLSIQSRVELPRKEVQDLIASSPGLKVLHLHQMDDLENETNGYPEILCGLKAPGCAVETLIVDEIWNSHVELLLDALPFFRSLQVIQFNSLGNGINKRRFMTAFRRNRSVVKLTVAGPFLTDEDKERLQRYSRRNAGLTAIAQSFSVQDASAEAGAAGGDNADGPENHADRLAIMAGVIPTVTCVANDGAAVPQAKSVLAALLSIGSGQSVGSAAANDNH